MKQDIEKALDDIFDYDNTVVLEFLLRLLGDEKILELRDLLYPNRDYKKYEYR